jgi:hypothetical protein
VQGVGVQSSTADTELGTGVVERLVDVRAMPDIELDPRLRVLVHKLETSREWFQGEGDDGGRVELLCHPRSRLLNGRLPSKRRTASD